MEQEKNKYDAKADGYGTGKLQPKAIVSVTGTPSFAGVHLESAGLTDRHAHA
jgi:hypothetical protein